MLWCPVRFPLKNDIRFVFTQGRIQGAHPARPLSLRLEKIRFFGVKSWFFTRNTPKIFAPSSARHNFFKCASPSLKSSIRPCYLQLFEGGLISILRYLCLVAIVMSSTYRVVFLFCFSSSCTVVKDQQLIHSHIRIVPWFKKFYRSWNYDMQHSTVLFIHWSIWKGKTKKYHNVRTVIKIQ